MTTPPLLAEARPPAAPPRRRWRARPRPEASPAGEWPRLIARLLSMRGVRTTDDARRFMGPVDAQPDPYVLPDLAIAIDRLLQATKRGECVAVFGDFDVDGVTSTAQLTQALSALGANPLSYVPDRFTEGYGLNIPAIERLRSLGATLLITADCGTSSIDEVARARDIGMDVIILDHHTTPPALPAANALVNPKLPGARPGGLLELATAGLAFHVASALHEAAGVAFDPQQYLDLAALGTVCDMAPLADENRRLLRAGLPALTMTTRPGVRALMELARVDPVCVSAADIGYKLGPRLNAAGRIEHANLALELLTTADEERGRELALALDALNRQRQDRTAAAVAQATQMIGDEEPPPLIMLGSPEFSSGIVGLIASKLVNLYGRPAVVYEEGGATSRASCRSIDEFHITDALRSRADLFVRFGGHRAAAGFTVENRNLPGVREHLIDAAARELAGRDLAPVIEIDANLPLRQLRGEEIRWLSRLGPFGIGNPEPTFLARDVLAVETRVVGSGDQHLKLKLRDGRATWAAIAFDMGGAGVSEGDRVDIVYTLESGGRDDALEVHVLDIRAAQPA